MDTWEHGLGVVPVSDVIDRFSLFAADADGLTVSGGEPFDQPLSLAILLAGWRSSSNGSVLVFTGREFAEVEPWLAVHRGLVDVLIAGPFRSDHPQTLALRGSDNQTLHVLTPLGEEFRRYERQADETDRRLDVMFDEEGNAWLAGIPARGDIGRLRRALTAAGHRAITSDSPGAFAA
jgi:anaerobic ribonucleoside-triphosphate reductase activating protein